MRELYSLAREAIETEKKSTDIVRKYYRGLNMDEKRDILQERIDA